MRLCKLALVFGVAALLAGPALAQPGGRGGFFGGPDRLLRVEKVQKDLGIDKDQMAKITTAIKKVQEDNKDDLAKLRDRDTKLEDRIVIGKKMGTAYEKALKGVLTEKQTKRLKQIQRQLMGINLFQDEEIQKTLKLSDDQKDKIKEINKDLQKEMADLRSGGFNPDNIAKMTTLRKDALSNAMKVLKADQKKQVKEMTGKPLELTIQDLFQGRGVKPGGKPRTDF